MSWRPLRTWRTALVDWVAERLPGKARFPTEKVGQWLETHDPAGRLFASPGDLLPLLAFVHDRGLRDLARRSVDLPRMVLARRLAALDDGVRASWLAAHGERLVEAVVEARLPDLSHGFGEPLSREAWAALVPEELAPSVPSSLLRRETEELVAEKSPTRRRQAAKRLERQWARLSAREAIDGLIEAGLLRLVREGAYLPNPGWILRFIGVAAATRALHDQDVGAWGRMAAESSRIPLFDQALDTLPVNDLVVLIKRSTRPSEARSFGESAAIEALFAVVARRLEEPALRREALALCGLAEAQIAQLVPRDRASSDLLRWPLTRVDSFGRLDQTNWFAATWTWSMGCPGLLQVPEELAWLFPGWARPSLASMPHQMRGFSDDGGTLARQRLHTLAPQVFRRATDTGVPTDDHHNAIHAFPLELLQLAEERGWELTDYFVNFLFMGNWERPLLLQWVESLAEDRRCVIVVKLWRTHLSQRGNGYRFPWMGESVAMELFSRHLPSEEARRAGSERQFEWSVVSDPRRWPIRLWIEVMHGLLKVDGLPGPLGHVDDETWAPETAEIVELLVPRFSSPWMGFKMLWRIAPERALRRARSAMAEGHADAEKWFLAVADRAQAFPALLTIAEAGPLPLDASWLRLWLAHMMPVAGALAERVYKLLKAIPGD